VLPAARGFHPSLPQAVPSGLRCRLYCGLSFVAAWLPLGVLIVARILQGAGGGALQPLSAGDLVGVFSPPNTARRSVWGLGVVVAPVLGPVLGGWITAIIPGACSSI